MTAPKHDKDDKDDDVKPGTPPTTQETPAQKKLREEKAKNPRDERPEDREKRETLDAREGRATGVDVVAIKLGFYGRRRKPGDRFLLSDPRDFSARWMEYASDATKATTPEPSYKSRVHLQGDLPAGQHVLGAEN